MGIGIEEYRSRVGRFAGGRNHKKKQFEHGLHFTKGMLAFCVLTILLSIAGIESNPGPLSNEEILARMEEMHAEVKREIGQVKTGLDSVRNEIDEVKNACEVVKESCADLKTATDNISMKIDDMESRIDELEMKQEVDRDRLDTVDCDNQSLKSIIDGLENEIDDLESRSRRENLRFFGIEENGTDVHENCTTTVVRMLNKFFAFKTWSADDISRAHRVGARENARNARHLIAKFTRWSDVDAILKDREARERMKKDGLRVSTDLTRRQMSQIKEAQANGKFAYFKRGHLVVEERHNIGRETSNEGNRRGHSRHHRSKSRGRKNGGVQTRSGRAAGGGGRGSDGAESSARRF